MSDSDSDSYEVVEKDHYTPPAHLPPLHHGSSFHRRESCNLPEINIDNRPPMPTPKSPQIMPGAGRVAPIPLRAHSDSTNSTYDRISNYLPTTLSLSQSPPIHQLSHDKQAGTPPPLPPMNPHRRPPTRSMSEGSDSGIIRGNGGSKLHPHAHYIIPTGGSSSSSSSSGKSYSSDGSWKLSSLSSASTHSRSLSNESVNGSSIAGTSDKYVQDSKSMSLNEFIEKHKKSLPVQVVVTKGYYGACERTSISDGDTFSIHFFKQTRVVKIQDSNGYKYTVPLNSSVRFGPVYDLKSLKTPADAKYHFKTVSEIVQLKELPKALRATKAFKGSSQENSVEENDLLLVREVKQKRGLRTSKVLKCIHAATGKKKNLQEECAGYFSVSSSDTQLYLPEIIDHLSLPQSAVIYLTSEKADIPSYLVEAEVKILEVSIEKSLVATTILEEQNSVDHMSHQYENYGSMPLVDIPVSLDIELAIIRLAEVETDQLYSNTRQLFEKFDPGQVSYLNLKDSVTADAQSAFFTNVRQDRNRIGVELIPPSNIFKSSPTLSLKRLSSASSHSQLPLPSPSECANAEEVNGRLETLERKAEVSHKWHSLD